MPARLSMRRLSCRLAAIAIAAAFAMPPAMNAASAASADAGDAGGAARAAKGPTNRYVFAVSWEPAFCESQSRKPECRSQTAERADATAFSLHGLWPQPRSNDYCGVSPEMLALDKKGKWDALPAPEIGAAVKAALDRAMPGTQSKLERHEWLRHGTCSGLSADTYFAAAIHMTEAVNRSEVGKLFAAHVGDTLTAEAIRAAFDRSFGEGAGKRVRISCRKDGDRRLIEEVTIGIVGEVGAEADLSKLILASRPTKPGCPEGIVDPAGLQ